MTNSEAYEHFKKQADMFSGEHREAIDAAIGLYRKIESLQNEYRAYHYDSEYWRAVKSVLNALELK